MWYKFVSIGAGGETTVYFCSAESSTAAKTHLKNRHQSRSDVIADCWPDLNILLEPFGLTEANFAKSTGCIYAKNTYVFVSRAVPSAESIAVYPIADKIRVRCKTCRGN